MGIATRTSDHGTSDFQVGDRVVVKDHLPHLPRTALTREQRTGIVVATGQATTEVLCYIDLGWPVYTGSLDSVGAARDQLEAVRAIRPDFVGDGDSIIAISASYLVPA